MSEDEKDWDGEDTPKQDETKVVSAAKGTPVESEEAPSDTPAEAENAPSVPSAALLAESPEAAEPGDIVMAVEPPTESFSAYGVVLTQDPVAVPHDLQAHVRRSAAEAGVTILEGVAE